jgi:CheY-like chemotaxis protein
MLKQAVAARNPFSIAIIDMQMPEMDGLAFSVAVKSEPVLAGTKLVILSSLGDQYRSVMEKVGIDAIVNKPVKQSALLSILVKMQDRSTPMEKSGCGSQPVTAYHDAEARTMRQHLRILVAEDNSINLKLALRMLQKLGCRADGVANGREALEALRQIPYDLVFMDSQMPEMDGLEATSEIRRMEGTKKHTPVIAFTANAWREDRERCIAAGMDDHLAKPVKENDLAGMIDKWSSRAWMTSAHDRQTFAAAHGDQDMLDMERLNDLMVLEDGDDTGWFAECVRTFVNETALGMARMRQAVDRGDLKSLAGIAHEYKGTCANIGANAMEKLCRELELASKKGALNEAAEITQQLTREFDRARVALESHQRAKEKIA